MKKANFMKPEFLAFKEIFSVLFVISLFTAKQKNIHVNILSVLVPYF